MLAGSVQKQRCPRNPVTSAERSALVSSSTTWDSFRHWVTNPRPSPRSPKSLWHFIADVKDGFPAINWKASQWVITNQDHLGSFWIFLFLVGDRKNPSKEVINISYPQMTQLTLDADISWQKWKVHAFKDLPRKQVRAAAERKAFNPVCVDIDLHFNSIYVC